MSKINTEHLTRQAIDMFDNRLSTRFKTIWRVSEGSMHSPISWLLGWKNVVVIDDDLGRSGSGSLRPGFASGLPRWRRYAGALCIDCSRLARNGRDWHTLLEFCRLVNTLIIDEDGIYDGRESNDRLVLGMKGTSEMEDSQLCDSDTQEAFMPSTNRSFDWRTS